MDVVDGELRLWTPDGHQLGGDDLRGAVITTTAYSVRLDGSHRDTDGLWRYQLTVVGDGPESPLCSPDAHRERWALPYTDRDGRVSFACTSGAIGKCLLFGYRPGRDQRLHDACVRMIRADYGGDDTSYTREGVHIAFCDTRGVHPCRHVPARIEAAWTDIGASCVEHTRVPELASLDQLADRYVRLHGHLGASCTGTADALLIEWLAD